jgi:Trk K+ transport system NAD-binding subunit
LAVVQLSVKGHLPCFDGESVRDLQLRRKYNANLVLIKRNGKGWADKEKSPVIHVPTPETIVYEGDVLMVARADLDLVRLPQE